MAVTFEEEQRRLAGMQADKLGETRLTLEPLFNAFRFFFSNIQPLLRIGWPLLLAALAASLVLESLFGRIAGNLLMGVVYVGVAAIWAVAVHRWIVFEAPPPPGLYFYLRFRPAEWKFAILIVGWWFALTLGFGAVLIPVALSGGVTGSGFLAAIVALAGGLVLAWLAIRSCLVFPHLAVTERFDWRLSWQAMNGKFWPALVIFLASTLVFFVLGAVVNAPFQALGLVPTADSHGSPMGTVRPEPTFAAIFLYKSASIALAGISETVGIAILSYIYRDVIQAEQKRREPPDPESPPDEPITLDSKTWTG